MGNAVAGAAGGAATAGAGAAGPSPKARPWSPLTRGGGSKARPWSPLGRRRHTGCDEADVRQLRGRGALGGCGGNPGDLPVEATLGEAAGEPRCSGDAREDDDEVASSDRSAAGSGSATAPQSVPGPGQPGWLFAPPQLAQLDAQVSVLHGQIAARRAELEEMRREAPPLPPQEYTARAGNILAVVAAARASLAECQVHAGKSCRVASQLHDWFVANATALHISDPSAAPSAQLLRMLEACSGRLDGAVSAATRADGICVAVAADPKSAAVTGLWSATVDVGLLGGHHIQPHMDRTQQQPSAGLPAHLLSLPNAAAALPASPCMSPRLQARSPPGAEGRVLLPAPQPARPPFAGISTHACSSCPLAAPSSPTVVGALAAARTAACVPTPSSPSSPTGGGASGPRAYAGFLTHPAFGPASVQLAVELDASSRGRWHAAGNSQDVEMWEDAGEAGGTGRVILRDLPDSTTLLDGTRGMAGALHGEVVHGGVRGGNFLLRPSQPENAMGAAV